MFQYRAKILSIYDADTVTADVDLGFGVWMAAQKIRLYGINAPEVKGESKVEGTAARDFLREMIAGKMVTLTTHKDKREKFGRWLGEIILETDDGPVYVNQLLVDRGFAVPFMAED